jgi:hypothetical protein
MSCQAEGETGWACTPVLNQAVFSPTTEPAGRHLNERSENNTPQIAHVGEKNRKNRKHHERAFRRNAASPSP